MITILALLGGGLYAALAGGGSRPASGSMVSARHLCSGDDWRLLPPGINGATGAVTGAVAIALRGASPCRLQTELTFSVQGQTGTTWTALGNLRSNPERMPINTVLRHGDRLIRVWGWWNYCARQSGPFRFQVTAGGQSAATRVIPPACESAAGPRSRLAASRRRWSAGGLARLPGTP